MLTTVTASFNKLSPKTTMYKISFTWISSKTASTATGSTALINAENKNICKSGVSNPKRPLLPNTHNEAPMNNLKQKNKKKIVKNKKKRNVKKNIKTFD